MNTQVLEEIQPIILANAHAFAMKDYVTAQGEEAFQYEILEPEQNICGSACCIGGTIVAHVDKVNLLEAYARDDRWEIGDRAAKILGAGNDGSSVGLFHLNHWPHALQKAYHTAENDLERAKIACEAIRAYADDPAKFGPFDDKDDEVEDDTDDYEYDGDEEG